MQTIALIDSGSGNLRSVERALLTAASQANRRREVRMTRDPDFVRRADRIVLPGQGAFRTTMTGLAAAPGLLDALTEAVRGRAAPFLGVCVGLQILMDKGLEHGETQGLGWIAGLCRPLNSGPLPLPHMGWNAAVASPIVHPVLTPIAPARHVYFAHSFVVAPSEPETIAASAHYGETFPAALRKDNILGVQFHPEKSQSAGLAMLARFIDWTP